MSTFRSRKTTLADLVRDYRAAATEARVASARNTRAAIYRRLPDHDTAAAEAAAMNRRRRITNVLSIAAHRPLAKLLQHEREATRVVGYAVDAIEAVTSDGLDQAIADLAAARADVATYLAAHPMCGKCFYPLPSPTPERCSRDWCDRIAAAPATCTDSIDPAHRPA